MYSSRTEASSSSPPTSSSRDSQRAVDIDAYYPRNYHHHHPHSHHHHHKYDHHHHQQEVEEEEEDQEQQHEGRGRAGRGGGGGGRGEQTSAAYEMSQYQSTRFQDEMIEPTFNLRLIEAVRHSRCLFDNTDRQYRNTDYKNRVWARLVTVLSFEGDPRMLSARWKQLRDKYGKEKRKQKYGQDKSSWQYFKHLHFLDPHMTDRADVSPSRKEPVGVHQKVQEPHFAKSLIREVHRHPCLYDVRDPKYRHSDCRNAAWNQIIDKLHYPGTINSIYKQWKKHRDRYVREKRRLRNIVVGEISPDMSTWEFFEDMTWIDQHLDEQQLSRCARTLKRSGGGGGQGDVNQDDGGMSEYEAEFDPEDDMNYLMMPPKPTTNTNGDVLLDGDSAFSASIVSDLRTLSEENRMLAKQQIIALLDSAGTATTPAPGYM